MSITSVEYYVSLERAAREASRVSIDSNMVLRDRHYAKNLPSLKLTLLTVPFVLRSQ